MRESVADVLWTGGWDSTFRILQALLIEQRVVQPCYVIDPDQYEWLGRLGEIARRHGFDDILEPISAGDRAVSAIPAATPSKRGMHAGSRG